MTNLARLTLPDPDNPGEYFDASIDTNSDHYSLLADEDNVLIKELIASQASIDAPGGGGYTMLTVAHNLGYIPLSFPYALVPTVIGLSSVDLWYLITNQFNPFEVPYALAAVDTKNFYFVNFGAYPNLPVYYRIFYDDMSNEDQILNQQTELTPPGTVTNETSVGTVDWVNPDNVKLSDDTYATVTLNNNTSHRLKSANFGFNIPSNATIKGIFASIEGKYSGSSSWLIADIRLMKNGVLGSTVKSITVTPTDAIYPLGNNEDLWGDTWTPDDINNTNFGIALYTTQPVASTRTISLDQIKIKVYYSIPGNPTITEDSSGVKFVRPGKSAKSKNPNDYIMHTSLNNLKIIHQEVQTVSLSSGMNTIAHNANIDEPVQCVAFAKFPDGKTAFVSALAATYSYDESKWVSISADKDNLYINSSGSFSIDISYFFFGKGKDGTAPTLTPGTPILAWTHNNKHVFKSTNPDDFSFHSGYRTLKYYASGSYNMGSVNDTTTAILNHGLGYVPFFAGYVSDLNQFNIFNNNSEPVYALTPYYLGRSTLGSPSQDVGAFIYADEDNLYFKAYFQTNAIGTSFAFNKFFYKLFKNNLNL